MLVGHAIGIHDHQDIKKPRCSNGKKDQRHSSSVTEKAQQTQNTAPQHRLAAIIQPFHGHDLHHFFSPGTKFPLCHDKLLLVLHAETPGIQYTRVALKIKYRACTQYSSRDDGDRHIYPPS